MRRTKMVCLALLALSTQAGAADDMIAISHFGDVYTINSSTGTSSFLGSSGVACANAMAIDAVGDIYVADVFGGLHRTAESTGLATTLGNLGRDVRGLAFNSASVLYAIFKTGAPGAGTSIDELYTINVNTLATTLVGSTGRLGIQALAFDANDTLYGWDVLSTGLNTLDTTTGCATDVSTTVGTGAESIQCLSFAPDGTLYGGSMGLFTIDVSTGKWFPVGTGGLLNLRGLVAALRQRILRATRHSPDQALVRSGAGNRAATCRDQLFEPIPSVPGVVWIQSDSGLRILGRYAAGRSRRRRGAADSSVRMGCAAAHPGQSNALWSQSVHADDPNRRWCGVWHQLVTGTAGDDGPLIAS